MKVFLFESKGENFYKGDRVKFLAYQPEWEEFIGTLTDKERKGSCVEVVDDNGEKHYGWYGNVKHLNN